MFYFNIVLKASVHMKKIKSILVLVDGPNKHIISSLPANVQIVGFTFIRFFLVRRKQKSSI